MREIKFRAWDKKDKCWADIEDFHICLDGTLYNARTDDYYPNSNDSRDRFELMQYTGLKDKNDKEIYEGDMLKDTYIIEGKQEIDIGVIEFTSGCTCLKYNDSEQEYYPVYRGLANYEVIGNIYENPELLTVKESVSNV